MSITFEEAVYTYSTGTAYEITALDHVSLHIEQGEFVGVIGHTGSGKSTLVQLMNGLIRPSAGRVLYNGEDIWADGFDRRKHRFRVGLVFQYPEHQLFESTVLADVCFGPKNQGLSPEACKEQALRALEQVGLPKECYEKSPFELSGGQKRKAAIAGVLAMNPEVMILDEPTAGLDPKGRDEVLDQLESLQHDRGITIVLVSHSMEDVAKYVDRILVMNSGKKIFDDIPGNVFRHYKELEQMGLAAPQMTYILHALAENGLAVNTDEITLEGAKNTILEALKQRDGRQ